MTDAQIGARLRQILTDDKTHAAQKNLIFSSMALRWPELHKLLTDPELIGEREYAGDTPFLTDDDNLSPHEQAIKAEMEDRGTVFGEFGA